MNGIGAGGTHIGGGVKIGLADFKVDDIASLRFQRAGSHQNLERRLCSKALHARRELHHSLLPTDANPRKAKDNGQSSHDVPVR
jgi:hypothetical protein